MIWRSMLIQELIKRFTDASADALPHKTLRYALWLPGSYDFDII